LRIRIVGTEEECQVAADRLARAFTVRSVPRPSLRDDGLYQVSLVAQLREQDKTEPPSGARRVGGPPPPRTRPRRER
jgi:hypothetical protein